MRAEMVVGDIFMVITSTGRRTSEALRGFAPSALSPCGSRDLRSSTIHHFPTNTEHQPFCVGILVINHKAAMQIFVKDVSVKI